MTDKHGTHDTAIQHWSGDIHQGDAVETLREMPDSSIHMAMCSPPYFGLRDYGVDGQIGLEENLSEYIDNLVGVAEELRRVLRDDGSWWLNLGDSFAGSWGAQSKDETENNLPQHGHPDKNPARNGQLRRKSKMLVPHRVAIALEDAGWIVRSDAVWAKPNPMPHPVKDRLNEHKEFLFHITPEPDYWFDLDAVREPHAESTVRDAEREYGWNDNKVNPQNIEHHGEGGINDPESSREEFLHPGGKNPGDILEITVKSFPEAHFAVYPPELCELPIKSSCPPTVCAECGTPYERDVDRTPGEYDYTDRMAEMGEFGRAQASGTVKELPKAEMNGWEQACDCETDETEPGIVLDPFSGAGTTALVGKRLGRRFTGIELNPEYVALAQKRIGVTVDEPERLLEDGETSITAYADGGQP